MFSQAYRLTVSTGCSSGLHWRPLTERIGILMWLADGIAAALSSKPSQEWPSGVWVLFLPGLASEWLPLNGSADGHAL
jgi:hypothetical protein